MVSPGGSAALYGVLYQLLASLHHAVRLRLTRRDGEVVAARLVVEPSQGGDLRIELPGRRIVEQWKARTTGRRWGLQEILTKVVPDLYRDRALDLPDDRTEYVFATEGLAGTEALAFFLRLRTPFPDAGGPLAGLSGEDRRVFRGAAAALRKRRSSRSEPLAVTHRRLRRLLGHFEIQEGRTADRLSTEIDRLLRSVVDHVDDLASIRDGLCTLILRKASQGEVRLVPEDLLIEAGVRAISLADADGLRRAARELLVRELERRTYRREYDVRGAPAWPEGRRFLVISGESGQGKTWQLSRLAIDLASEEDGGPLVVFLESTGQAAGDLQKASDLLWGAWGHDQSISLARLAARWRESQGVARRSWLVVCVDGVQTSSDARSLIDSFDWERWDLRLALSAPRSVGELLGRERPDQIQLLVMRDFSVVELRQCLLQLGHAWESVPFDVRDTLRRPLLARIYGTVSAEQRWVPRREYELYEGYWRWLQSVRDQSDHPEDFLHLKRLALTLLSEEARYPWTLEQLEGAGVTGEARSRLERAGWWNRTDGGAEVWHDRLLSWCVAEALAERAAEADLPERLVHCIKARGRTGRSLGYVPMDVLWLLSNKPGNTGLVAGLIARFERQDAFGYQPTYQMLSTLGPRIVPGLLEHLGRVSDERFSVPVRLVAETITGIFAEDRALGEQQLPPLLEHAGAVRDVAVEVLGSCPSAAAIPRLWEIHKARALALEPDRELDDRLAYQKSFKALAACLDLDPSFLTPRIAQSEPEAEPIWELAKVLAELEHPLAGAIWKQVKGDLFRKVPPARRRPLASCIRAFDDREEVSRLESWLSIEEDWTRYFAFWALAWVAPDRAVVRLRDVPVDILAEDIAGSWFGVVLPRRPEATRNALRGRIASAGADFWEVADRYRWHEQDLDRATVDLLLERLASDVATFSGDAESARIAFSRPLRRVSRIHRLDLLRAFEPLAGTELDRRLGELGAAWLAAPREHDLDDLRSVLLKIGGEGYRRLIREGLESEKPERHEEALTWGMATPEEVTTKAARGAWALAAVGPDRALVEDLLVVEREMTNDLLRKLWRLRRARPPMSDADLAPALDALASREATRRRRGLAMVSISGRADLLAHLSTWLEGFETTEARELDATAAFLVHRLGNESPAIVRQLARSLDIELSPYTLVTLLPKPGAEELPARLERHLLASLAHFGEAEMWLALSLRQVKELDPSLLRAIWRYGQRYRHWNNEEFWATVAPLGAEGVHDEVLNVSLDRGISHERRAGIAGLRFLDAAAAFTIAEQHLRGTDQGRGDFVQLLLDLDASKAIDVLLEQAVRERQTEVLWTIARALRRAGPEVEVQVRARLESPDSRVRMAAAHLAGWQGPSFLQAELSRLAESDPKRGVQWECLRALDRQGRERDVFELMDAFRGTRGTARWSYLESILELADPRLLVTEGDPLWLAQILPPELGVLEVHANWRLEQRFKEVKGAAELRDRNLDD